ncbi:MAG: nuclear transport factor 2 family protein [Bradyrhizobium sp.]
MADDLNRQCMLKFFDAYYSGDAETATACCAEDFETITYAPVDLFPHLGAKQGRAWVGEAIRTQQARYKNRKYELKMTAVDGDNVAAIQFLSLTKRSDDRIVHLETAEFFTFRAGLILTHRGFFDSFDFVQQLLGRDLTDSFASSVRDAMQR